MLVARATSSLVVVCGFLSCCSRVLLSKSGGVGSTWKSSGVISVGLGLISSCDGELGVSLESLQVNWATS